ncbi:MAG: putative MPP superfamily phosphohydrolase [Myxococcota bacterium]|jgi:predicted MPP superfamily phosphohydrolase
MTDSTGRSLPLLLLAAILLLIATLVRVYRGGTTLNDHAVAAVVSGCLAIYPLLWWGGGQGPVLTAGAGAGMVCIYGIFHILDQRREPGRIGRWVGTLSQPAYAFSLWTGLLLVFWIPAAILLGHPPLWPGWRLLLPAGLATWGTIWTYLRRDHLVTHHLPGPGLRIAHLSDIHVSPLMTRVDMLRLVSIVETQSPDLVVVTGDLVMPFSETSHGFLIETLAMFSAPVLCCMGNHDLPIAETLKTELEAAGIRMLVNERAVLTVRGLTVEVVGLDFVWQWAWERSLAALGVLGEVSADYRILLAHDPRYFKFIPTDRFELVLSGHTHGGQVGTNMFGVPWSVLRPMGVYDQGFFQRDDCRLFVHKGSWHTGLPPRMGIASEVVVLQCGTTSTPSPIVAPA